MTLRDFGFRIRHGFRGYPVTIGAQKFRVDESLRRWDFDDEVEVRTALTEHLGPGDVGIDIGANFGMHSLIMARQVAPGGRVLAFEPIPENHRLFCRNVALNRLGGVVTIYRQAVSDRPDAEVEMMFEQSGLEPAAGIRHAGSGEGVALRVPNVSLDYACRELDGNSRCLVKIDVEGAELSVLRSGAAFIRRARPKMVIEVHDFALPGFGESTALFYAFLKDVGYVTQRLSTKRSRQGEYHHVLAQPKS